MSSPGGQGDAPSRGELRLEEQALRNDWPIPPRVRRQILQRLVNFVDGDEALELAVAEGEDARPSTLPEKPYSDRTVIAAARVLAQFAKLSLGQAKLDLERELAEMRLGRSRGSLTLADLVEAAEARAMARGQDGEGYGGEGSPGGAAGPLP